MKEWTLDNITRWLSTGILALAVIFDVLKIEFLVAVFGSLTVLYLIDIKQEIQKQSIMLALKCRVNDKDVAKK